MPEKVYPKSIRNMSHRSRVFAAITLPVELKTKIATLTEQLETENRNVEWRDAQKSHITLMFLGHIAQERLQAAAGSLKEVASRHQPFELITGPLDYFFTEKDGDRSVIFISVQDPERKLHTLYKDFARVLATQDFYPPERIHPHITLGKLDKDRDRAKQTQTLDKLTQDESLQNHSIPVTQLHLYEKLQQRGGEVRYRLLRTYTLSG